MTTPPGDRRAAGGMSSGFDVLVRSMDALNASMRLMSQDMQRVFNAQETFAPGSSRSPYSGQPSPPAGQPMSYNPQAGQTNQGNTGGYSLGRAAHNFSQVFFGGQGQQTYSPYQQPPQPPYQPPPAPPSPQPPRQPQGPLGNYPPPPAPPGPGGGGSGGPGGPQGPAGPQPGPGPGQPQTGPGGQPHQPYQGGGGGWTNMLLNAGRRTPYLGSAMVGISSIQNLYLSEREKNRLYQGMEGGSNFDGFKERFHEEVYRWSMPGMSGDMARRSFKGVTAMGYTGKIEDRGPGGQGRQDALDFVYHNYNARGMDVEESLGMLQTASKDATVNFTELSEALKDVSDTAGKAGVNAKFMRQSFQGMLQASIGTGAGPGAADLAGIFSSTQASYGREFQGQDFRGQLDRNYQYMIGAQYGVSPGQLQGIMRNRPDEYARMVSGSQMSWIKTFFGPQQIQHLKQLIDKYGTSQMAVSQIEQEFLNAHPEIDLHLIAENLSGSLTGVQLDASNVMDWVIQQLSGNTAAAHTDQPGGRKPVDVNTGKDVEGFLKTPKPGQNAPTGKYGLLDKKTLLKEGDGHSLSGYLSVINAGSEFAGFGEEENKAGEVYVDWMEKSKKRDPVLEALLQNVEDPNETKVRVSTSEGDRIVTFAEAMKHFPNELASGKVKIVTGDQAGKTTGQVVGGNADPSRNVKKEMTSEAGAEAGLSIKEYEKKYGKLDKGSDAVERRVTVDLTQEAKRLIQLLPSMNNESSATGYPPYNPHPHQGSRP